MSHSSFGHLAMDPVRSNSRSDLCAYGGPEPNPPFVFPMQPEAPGVMGSTERASTRDITRGRRSMNRPQKLALNNPLPPFEFHSSASSSATTQNGSPARSPRKNPSGSTQSSGHRRNGSEFIGGDSRSGTLGFMSTSPTKGEGTLPTPSASRTGPPVNRPRHAHRRSGAISSHDLSMMLKPSSEPRGGSAPTTPSVLTQQNPFSPEIERSESQPIPTLSTLSTPSKRDASTSAIHRASASFEGQSRPRVGFSDNLEFIPRPLSTISSETSSSLSTLRPNHSLTGSITSIVSAGTSSPPSAKVTSSALDTMFEIDLSQPRPRTASPTIHGSKQRFTSQEERTKFQLPPSLFMPNETAPEVKSPRPWRSTTGTRSQDELSSFPTKQASSVKPVEVYSTIESSEPPHVSQSPAPVAARLRTSPEPKRAKRQKKSWAGSILSRRARRRDIKEKREVRRSPTPPLRQFAPPSDMRFEDVNFDEDTTCVVQTPQVHEANVPRVQTDNIPSKSHSSSSVLDSDSSDTMFDLDAALGADLHDATAGGFLIPRRKMHSSVPKGDWHNMYYHRRAESAPEMMAPNPFSFPRARSNPAMADVFEEEEEEDDDDASGKEDAITSRQEDFQDSNSIPGLAVKIVDSDSTDVSPIKRRTAGELNAPDHPLTSTEVKREQSMSPVRSNVLADDIEIVNADEEPRASVVTKSSDESTITVNLSNDPYARRPASAPIDFAMSRSANIFMAPETSSCISSPDCNRISFDGSRMHTAHSSMTDRATLSSLRTGDHGFSMRGSVDDVPSLISSPSTTIISTCPPRFSSSAGTRSSGDHSSTLPTAVPRRTRHEHAGKRSSLSNLSRLIGVSHGEKSKLSIEEHAEPDNTEKKERKKGNRISRLMRFWK